MSAIQKEESQPIELKGISIAQNGKFQICLKGIHNLHSIWYLSFEAHFL